MLNVGTRCVSSTSKAQILPSVIVLLERAAVFSGFYASVFTCLHGCMEVSATLLLSAEQTQGFINNQWLCRTFWELKVWFRTKCGVVLRYMDLKLTLRKAALAVMSHAGKIKVWKVLGPSGFKSSTEFHRVKAVLIFFMWFLCPFFSYVGFVVVTLPQYLISKSNADPQYYIKI